MDLSFSAEERAFEQDVRDFIAANLTPEMKRATALTPSVFSDPDIGMAWQRTLHKRGWGAPGWPVEYGGPDWTPGHAWACAGDREEPARNPLLVTGPPGDSPVPPRRPDRDGETPPAVTQGT